VVGGFSIKGVVRKGNGWYLVVLMGMLACLSACEEDNPVPLEEIVKANVVPRVSFDLYSTFDTISPLTMTLTSSEEATVYYTWCKVDENKGDIVLNEGAIAHFGGQISLEYTFTEEQLANDFPLHSLAPQKYYCQAVVSQKGRDDNLIICDTVEVVPTLPQGLPIVWVWTVDNEEPTCEYVEAPPEGVSHSIRNATKVPGRVIITENVDTLFDTGEYIKGESGMTIKIRGNSTPYFDKKPFKIKLQKKGDLLCRGDDYADKNWLLIKDGDQSINAFIGFKTNDYFQLQWTPSFRYVNLVFNNEYRGFYMLIEAVERNPKCRLNVQKDTGFIIEYDAYWWNEDLYFDSDINPLFNFTFKYPDPDDITEERYQEIKKSVNSLEKHVIQGGQLSDVIDIDSFVSWVLAQDILGNMDGWGSNIFMTKYDNSTSSKFMMGNMWDFDDIMLAQGRFSSCHNKFYFETFFKDPDFLQAYSTLWNSKKINYYNYIHDQLSELQDSELGQALQLLRSFDSKRWGYEIHPLWDDIKKAELYFQGRMNWLNNAITVD
jgi:hypothetical protein